MGSEIFPLLKLNLQLLDFLLMLIILSLNINQQSHHTGGLHRIYPIPHYLNDPPCSAAAAPQWSEMFVHLLANKCYVTVFENRSYFRLLLYISKNKKKICCSSRGKGQSQCLVTYYSQTLLKQDLVFSVATLFSVISMGHMNLLESATDGSHMGNYLIFSGFQCCFGHSRPGSLEKCLQGYKVVCNTVLVAFSLPWERLHGTLTMSRLCWFFFS